MEQNHHYIKNVSCGKDNESEKRKAVEDFSFIEKTPSYEILKVWEKNISVPMDLFYTAHMTSLNDQNSFMSLLKKASSLSQSNIEKNKKILKKIIGSISWNDWATARKGIGSLIKLTQLMKPDHSIFANMRFLDLSRSKVRVIRDGDLPSSIQSLYLFDAKSLNVLSVENLKQMKSLSLSLSDYIFTESSEGDDLPVYSYEEYPFKYEYIYELKLPSSLEALDLNKRNIKDFSFLKNLEKLKRLELSGCIIETEDFHFLKEHKKIEYLNLSANKITDIKDLSFLKDMQHLKGLNLSCFKVLQEEDLSFLKDLKNLESLNLSSINKINSYIRLEIKDLSFLNNMQHLKSLDLSSISIDGNISSESLNELNLSFTRLKNLSIKEMKNLKILNLSYSNVNNEKVELPSSLEKLDLSSSNITNIYFDECPDKLKDLKTEKIKEKITLHFPSSLSQEQQKFFESKGCVVILKK